MHKKNFVERLGYALQLWLMKRRAAAHSGLIPDEVLAIVNSLTNESRQPESQSQLGQDILALSLRSPSQGGYFVEFGAADGVAHSNSYLLEKRYGWHGILAEPARQFSEALAANRNCIVDTRCVWRTSGERLMFNDAATGVLSTLDQFSELDVGSGAHRESLDKYEVETVSLNDLLKGHNAPQKIDFLSIDTEGSEYEILSTFNFREYEIGLIVVEHNYTNMRKKIKSLLEARNYVRIFEPLSRWDDWYVLKR